jgi:hypothetical protein
MRSRLIIVLGLALVCPFVSLGADPVVDAPTPEPTEAPTPALAPPAPVVNEKPKPVEKAKPAEKIKPVEKPKPKPVEKPHLAADAVRPVEVPPSKSSEPSAPAAVPAPALASNGVAKQDETTTGYSLGCLALSFAMLILGVAAGFLGRHLMSRHKLGGMTVRIGTWRGIP